MTITLLFNKLCAKPPDMWMLSFNSLHEMVGRATPDKILDYKLALQLYKVVKNNVPTPDWININFNNIHTTRQTRFMTSKANRLKVGMNLISNRFYYLNGKIEMDWLNLSYNTYKVKCKKNISLKTKDRLQI